MSPNFASNIGGILANWLTAVSPEIIRKPMVFSNDYVGMDIDWFAWFSLIAENEIWQRYLTIFVLRTFLLTGLN